MAEFQTSRDIADMGTGKGTGREGATIVNGSKNRDIQRRALRPDGWNKAHKANFLRVLGTTCNVRAAAASVGLACSGAYALRLRDPVFAASWATALANGYDRLEEALLATAIAGLTGDVAGETCEDGGVGGNPAGENHFGENLAAVGGARVPNTGVVQLASMQAVQVALTMLGRYRAAQTAGGRRQKMRARRATADETNASIAKKLDVLARRLAAPVAVIVLGSPSSADEAGAGVGASGAGGCRVTAGAILENGAHYER